jgi:FkbM family methyltransferase
MKPFTEEERYNYDLTPESIVLDCGVYEGTFSDIISQKYKPLIYAYEPIAAFYQRSKERLKVWPNVKVFPYGVGSSTRNETFRVKGDMTGHYSEGLEQSSVLIVDIVDILKPFNRIDLLKLNIEGMEFEVLERILALQLQGIFKNIQVQPHGIVEDAENRWKSIQNQLLKTHKLTYSCPWTWENYEIL